MRCAARSPPRTWPHCSASPGSAARAPSGSSWSWATGSDRPGRRRTVVRRSPRTSAGPLWRRWWASAGTPGLRRMPYAPSCRTTPVRLTTPTSLRCSVPRCAPSGVDVAEDRVVAAEAEEVERAVEVALRPRRLSEFVGQQVVREQLELVLHAAIARGGIPDHVLLSGPPGLGKTTLAMIIAVELGTSVRVTSGPAIQHAGDLAAVLSSLEEGEVLFVDEIHRLALLEGRQDRGEVARVLDGRARCHAH